MTCCPFMWQRFGIFAHVCEAASDCDADRCAFFQGLRHKKKKKPVTLYYYYLKCIWLSPLDATESDTPGL